MTALRKTLLELIRESRGALTAYDLLEKFKPFSESAKPSTVYRVLDFLLQQGLIHKVANRNAFRTP